MTGIEDTVFALILTFMLLWAEPLQIDELLSFYTQSSQKLVEWPLLCWVIANSKRKVKSPHTFCRVRAYPELTWQAVKLPLVDQSKVMTILLLIHDLLPDKQMGLDSKENGKVENLSNELTSNRASHQPQAEQHQSSVPVEEKQIPK